MKRHRLDHEDDYRLAMKQKNDRARTRAAEKARSEAALKANEAKRRNAASSLNGFVFAQPEDWPCAPAGAAYNHIFKCWIVPKTKKSAARLMMDSFYSSKIWRSLDEFAAKKLPMSKGEINGFISRWRLI